MADYHFSHPIQIRYGDLDPQWHVNNARYLSFLEQARAAYIMQLGLFDGESFFDLGLIVADVHIAYKHPLKMTQQVIVRARVSRLGTKSLVFEYSIEDAQTGQVAATAETVMVHFDYHANASTPWPAMWRERISAFEGIDAGGPH